MRATAAVNCLPQASRTTRSTRSNVGLTASNGALQREFAFDGLAAEEDVREAFHARLVVAVRAQYAARRIEHERVERLASAYQQCIGKCREQRAHRGLLTFVYVGAAHQHDGTFAAFAHVLDERVDLRRPRVE